MKITVTSLIACGMYVAPLEWKTQAHPRPYRLYFIRGGSAHLTIGNREYPLEKNRFYLFPSSLPFLIHQDPDNRLDHLFYDFFMSPPIIASEPLSCHIDEHPLLLPLLKTMERSASNFSLDSRDTIVAILEAFLTLFAEFKSFPCAKDSTILKSIAYMELHYSEPITVRDIAAEVFLNEDYFIRKFRKAIGMTPHAYLLKLRLSIASELISMGYSFAQVATEVGFQHPSSLYHAIQKSKS